MIQQTQIMVIQSRSNLALIILDTTGFQSRILVTFGRSSFCEIKFANLERSMTEKLMIKEKKNLQ